jgi:hypothetical protein
MPYEDPDDSELVTTTGGVWRARGCRGCGQGPEELARIDAIATAAFLQRRFASLLAHPEHSLRYRGPGRGSWSAMEPAVKVSEVLRIADGRLRTLLGEDLLDPIPGARHKEGTGSSAPTFAAVIAVLNATVRRLTGTIAGSTTEDWRRSDPDSGATAGELVWLALHEATHHLEDAELLLDSATNSGEQVHEAPGLHSVPEARKPDHTAS